MLSFINKPQVFLIKVVIPHSNSVIKRVIPLSQATKGAASKNDPFAEAERLEAYSHHKNTPKDKHSEEMSKVNLWQVIIKRYSFIIKFRPIDGPKYLRHGRI